MLFLQKKVLDYERVFVCVLVTQSQVFLLYVYVVTENVSISCNHITRKFVPEWD